MGRKTQKPVIFSAIKLGFQTQKWPSLTITNTYYLGMCRKPSQHSSHLLPSHSPELHQQSHSLTSCTDNPMPLVYSPTKIQKCYKLFRFGAGQLQVNPLSILLGCSSLVMLESAPWCSCLGLPAKPRKERDALNSTIQMENSMENTTSLSTSSLELVLR